MTTPTNSSAYLTVAVSEHWPGGTHKAALTTKNSATVAIANQSFKIGNSYTATVTYTQGAKFSGYAQE